jgi:hypothetical protein
MSGPSIAAHIGAWVVHEDGFRSGIDAAESRTGSLPELTSRTGAINDSDFSVDMGNADQRQGG